MTTPEETLNLAITRLASDRRRSAAYYGNLAPSPGSRRVPQRLLSDAGFPRATQFSYVAPAMAHVTRGEGPRTIRTLAIHPYGLAVDARLLRSTAPEDMVVWDEGSPTGVRIYPGVDTWVMPGRLLDDTYDVEKTSALLAGMTNAAAGPAYHVIIDRRGNVIIGAALDDVTHPPGVVDEGVVNVALEGALARRLEGEELRELPYRSIQLRALAALVAKLRAVETDFASELSAASGVAGLYVAWPELGETVSLGNFTGGSWRNGPFDFTASDDPGFFQLVNLEDPYDLATEVFRPANSPVPSTTRAQVAAAISRTDTAGRTSVYLGAYADIAARDRNAEMSLASRREFFVDRARGAHHDGVAGLVRAAEVHATAPTAEQPVQNSDPLMFNFSTGFFGDGKTY